MSRIDVVLLYEHAARELDVVCLLKHFLESRYGLSAKIVHFPYGMPDAFSGPKPGIVILPFCYHEEHYIQHLLLDWRRSVFVNLAWEQLLYPGNRRTKQPRGDFATKHVIHHAWGKFFEDFLRQNGVPPDNIYINGNPTLPLYDPPYSSYFKSRQELAREYHLNPESRWIFFPENYNWAFYPDENLKMITDSALADERILMRDFCRNSLTAVLQWCERLAEKPGTQIILRPRPSTPLEVFREKVASILPSLSERLVLLKNETIREWILASDIVISSYSTSLIEAAVARKPAYILEPVPMPEPLRVDWQSLIPHLRTNDEFQKVMSGALKPSDSEPLREWAVATMMSGGDPILNFAEFVSKVHRSEVKVPEYPPRDVVVKAGRRLPAWMHFEKRRITGRNQRREPLKANTMIHENDVVSEREINRRIERWKSLLS
jgi:surface carbohydrate biosynthesis protein